MQYEHSEHVAAAPDAVYQVLRNPDNLVQFVPQLTAISPAEGDTVEVQARYEGHTQHGEAWLRSDEAARRVEWGVPGGSYRGSLVVEPDGEGSKLVLELSTPHDHDVDKDVVGTLDAIRRLLEAEV